jgi:tRNA A-37 threonylcarbamoyl transferase component Bud32/transcriptional regulator with XRE-family HTH domain
VGGWSSIAPSSLRACPERSEGTTPAAPCTTCVLPSVHGSVETAQGYISQGKATDADPDHLQSDEFPMGQIPDGIGDYRVLQLLGQGAAGRVYLATPSKAKDFAKVGEPVALKVYKPEILAKPNELERIGRELRVGSTVAHPNLARIFEQNRDADGNPFLVMEFVDGIPLSKWISMFHPVAAPLLLGFVEQLVHGLAALHQRGVTHRDLKPANVMVTYAFDVRIMDFGVVRVTEDSPITDSNEVLGTIRNSSPELLRGERYDERTDLYSLGTVFYALLHGEEVFADERNKTRLLAMVQNEGPQFTPTGSSGPVESSLLALTKGLLEKEPKKRPHSIDEVRQEVTEIRGLMDRVEVNKPLHGYVATALTGLEPDARGYITFASSKIAEVAKRHGFYVYQPRRATDPVLNKDFDAETVYVLDRERVLRADLLFVLLNKPSFGVGQELEIAASYSKPTILIVEEGVVVSRMVHGSPANVLASIVYSTPEDLERQLDRALTDVTEDVIRWKERVGDPLRRIDLGPLLREKRIAAGYKSSGDFADKMGLSRRYVEFLEKGHLENAGNQILRRIGDVLAFDFGPLGGRDHDSERGRAQDLNIGRLEALASRLGWSSEMFLRVRGDYERERAARGSNEVISDDEWIRRRDRLERETI